MKEYEVKLTRVYTITENDVIGWEEEEEEYSTIYDALERKAKDIFADEVDYFNEDIDNFVSAKVVSVMK